MVWRCPFPTRCLFSVSHPFLIFIFFSPPAFNKANALVISNSLASGPWAMWCAAHLGLTMGLGSWRCTMMRWCIDAHWCQTEVVLGWTWLVSCQRRAPPKGSSYHQGHTKNVGKYPGSCCGHRESGQECPFCVQLCPPTGAAQCPPCPQVSNPPLTHGNLPWIRVTHMDSFQLPPVGSEDMEIVSMSLEMREAPTDTHIHCPCSE